MRVGIPALLVAFSIAPLAADEPAKSMTIQLSGAVEKPAEWSLEEIAKTFAADVTEVSYTLKGQAGKAHVVPLVKLVLAAKPKIDPAQKNHIIAFSVVVRGRDGYAATFSLAEIHPDFAAAAIYMALDKDGKPLPDREQPVSILAPGDKKPSRWVHGVASITVIDGLAAIKK
jgi:hypothetical protein